MIEQFGGSPIKVGEEEYSLFRDHEYGLHLCALKLSFLTASRLLAKINE